MTKTEIRNINYSVETTNEVMKLSGNFSIDTDKKLNYDVAVYLVKDNVYIGNASYSELEKGLINCTYNIPSEYKADVIALVDTSILEVKGRIK